MMWSRATRCADRLQGPQPIPCAIGCADRTITPGASHLGPHHQRNTELASARPGEENEIDRTLQRTRLMRSTT